MPCSCIVHGHIQIYCWLNGYQKRYGFVYVDREEDENSGTLNH
ncbi:MAG: family 1 glycosylhydrolase [Thomasclavelia ramosa]